MTMAIVNAWRSGHVSKNYSAVITSKDYDFLKIINIQKNKNVNDCLIALEIFGQEVDYYESNVYINFVPNASLAKCAQAKEVGRLIYWGKDKDKCLLEYTSFCTKFNFSLGSVIDLLSIVDK